MAVCIGGGQRGWKAGEGGSRGEVKGKEWEVRITAEGNDISRGDVEGVRKGRRLGEEGGEKRKVRKESDMEWSSEWGDKRGE